MQLASEEQTKTEFKPRAYDCEECGSEFYASNDHFVKFKEVGPAQCPVCKSKNTYPSLSFGYVWKCSGKTRFSTNIRKGPDGRMMRYTPETLDGRINPETGTDYATGQRFKSLEERENYLNKMGLRSANEDDISRERASKGDQERKDKVKNNKLAGKYNKIIGELKTTGRIK